ncbi:MAG: hypothetical protein C4345_10395, partial [Chloroflexota bacterium]
AGEDEGTLPEPTPEVPQPDAADSPTPVPTVINPSSALREPVVRLQASATCNRDGQLVGRARVMVQHAPVLVLSLTLVTIDGTPLSPIATTEPLPLEIPVGTRVIAWTGIATLPAEDQDLYLQAMIASRADPGVSYPLMTEVRG